MSRHSVQVFDATLAVGTPVQVRNGFNGAWSAGFQVDGTSGVGYWLRRRSDGSLLPTIFLGDDVRPEDGSYDEIDLRDIQAGRTRTPD